MMNSLSNKVIGFIGGGQMAEAIFAGLLHSGTLPATNILVADVSPERLGDVQQRFGVSTIVNDPATNSGAVTLVQRSDVVVLAVKPQYARPVLESTKAHYSGNQLVVSIMGGVALAFLEEFICAPIARVMPNTPMMVQEGVAGIALNAACSKEHGELVQAIFSPVGISYLLPESLIDPLTSVSGCGPAFSYLFIEAMADGGVEMGLPRDMAVTLAAKTLLGAAKMVLESGNHPGKLKDNVCSPGGSTIAGVHALERGGFRGVVMNAVEAAMNRMVEVGKKV